MKPEYDNLFHRFLDGNLEPREFGELNQLLRENESAADQFTELCLLHESLHSGFRSGEIPTRHTHAAVDPPVRKPSLPIRFSSIIPWTMAAAAAVLALLALKEDSPSNPSAPASAEVQDSGFAILTHCIDPIWKTGALHEGDLLAQDTFKLESGLAQIEFFSGVLVVVEGDATFEILSSNEMRLIDGKLRAQVPHPAIGFQIHTPQGTVVDLGTEFALDVDDEDSELHVLDGEVEWLEESQEKILLTEGRALALSDSTSRQIEAQPSRFTGPLQFTRLLTDYQNRRFDEWLSHSRSIEGHPDLVAYFPMSSLESGTRELPSTIGETIPGAIVGAKLVPGRWPRKKALDFSPNGSRVRVDIPGKLKAITYSTWARIDSLDRQYNALFLTDSYGYGEPHWQLLEDGRLFFSVGIGTGKFHHIFHSPVIWDHSKSEQWLHLVTTYDVETRTCAHYLNGEEISRDSAPPGKGVDALTIGSAQIGNWGLPTREEPDFAVRNLNGRLDEFAIFDRALNTTEVQALYQAGKP